MNHLTRQVAAISILEGALGREALLKSNSGADSEMACRHAQQQAELIYNYHTNRDRVINLHSQDGQLQLVDWSGNKIYPVIADYLTLSESNNGLIEALTRPSTSKRILWLSGRASPQLLSALSKQGIELVEQAQTTPLSVAEILLPERVQEQREAENKGNRTGEIASSIGSTIGSVFDAITPDLGEAEAPPEAQ
ncbi:hypothetical protein [Candidatus Reidiella endopervernicosa]|uniref:Uncharacterized protein n=1 Tax=Candidatus Reidiella endopervernicosa TaxID=2738883 RepID=A0A6N0HX34_9GAMM|nr:hypothetical protein [Candidatus Reidiella endopervernicosa]QKQ26807.1 hypothetical protein HUE57_11320 [Candidatus Reidiella endopervernicosa]